MAPVLFAIAVLGRDDGGDFTGVSTSTQRVDRFEDVFGRHAAQGELGVARRVFGRHVGRGPRGAMALADTAALLAAYSCADRPRYDRSPVVIAAAAAWVVNSYPRR